MSHKISIALLLVCMGTKALSQGIINTTILPAKDSIKIKKDIYENIINTSILPTKDASKIKAANINTSRFAVLEIAKNRPETVRIHYDDGKVEDITGKVYVMSSEDISTIADKAVICIKYMADRGYYLISSNAVVGAFTYRYFTYYNYQYVFEKKEK